MHSKVMQVPLFEFFLIHAIFFLYSCLYYLTDTLITFGLTNNVQILILFVMLFQFVLELYHLQLIIFVHPNHLYLAMQKTQTKNQTAMQEYSMYLMTCDVPTVLQMKGLQQFKYHILQLQFRKSNQGTGFYDVSYFQSQNLRIFFYYFQHMKGKSFVEKPFGKIQTKNHITVKISQAPPSSLNRQIYTQDKDQQYKIKEQINEIKARIQKSERVLSQSKRNEARNIKTVQSDYIPLSFNYESSKSYEPILQQLDQRQSQYSLQNQESEGRIQLPIHLQPSIDQRNYLSTRNTLKNKFFKSLNLPKQLCPDLRNGEYSQKNQRMFYLNELTNSLEKLNPNPYTKRVQTPKSNQKAGFYLDQYLKQKSLSKSKERNYAQNTRTKNQNIENSRQKKIIKSTSKNKQQNNGFKASHKIKIKLNRPNSGKIDIKDQYHTRPRYHIKMPAVKSYYQNTSTQQQEHVSLPSSTKNGWYQLKQKLKRYEFVRKYLNESDLHSIYQHLKKNHINQEKWPLFVVDQAYKRMNENKNR